MKVIRFPEKHLFNKPTLILGGFEIFHNGHLELYKKAKKISNGEIIIMVVENVLSLPKNNQKIIGCINSRLQQLANLGFDGVILMKINNNFIDQTGKEFIEKLKRLYGIDQLICGKDFKFGKFGKSNSSDLKSLFPKVHVCNIKKETNVKISTSLIKELIYYGDIEAANSLSVNKWTTEGLIDHGWVLVQNPNIIIPHPGIYSISVEYENTEYFGVLHISLKKEIKIFLIELNKFLLGRNVYIHWDRKIRTIVKTSEDGVNTKDVNFLKDLLSKEK